MMSSYSGIFVELANVDAADIPVQRCDSGPTFDSFRDLHADQPEETSSYTSSSMSENSEPSVGTKRAAEELRINLQKKIRRTPVQPADLSRSPRELQYQSQHMAAHGSQVTQPSTSRKKIQCDRVMRTSSEISDTENGIVPVMVVRPSGDVHIDSSNSHIREKRSNRKERKTVEIRVKKNVITDDEIEMVVKHLGNDWRHLGLKLGFVRGELDAFEYDNNMAGLHEIIHQMLISWREKLGGEAYVRHIATKLVEIKRADIAKLFSVN